CLRADGRIRSPRDLARGQHIPQRQTVGSDQLFLFLTRPRRFGTVQARQHRPETVAGMTVVEPGLPALRARPCAEDEHTRGMRADGGKLMHMHTSHRKYVSMAAAVPSSDAGGPTA